MEELTKIVVEEYPLQGNTKLDKSLLVDLSLIVITIVLLLTAPVSLQHILLKAPSSLGLPFLNVPRATLKQLQLGILSILNILYDTLTEEGNKCTQGSVRHFQLVLHSLLRISKLFFLEVQGDAKAEAKSYAGLVLDMRMASTSKNSFGDLI
ncbi:hypothetical protein LguiB_013780 [Lonicera macranthoides]